MWHCRCADERDRAAAGHSNNFGFAPIKDSSAQSDQSLMGTEWVAERLSVLDADSQDSDKAGQMLRLICFCWAQNPKLWICHTAVLKKLHGFVWLSKPVTNIMIYTGYAVRENALYNWLKKNNIWNSVFDCKLMPISDILQSKTLFLADNEPCLSTSLTFSTVTYPV